jgi:hypothetical protein
VSRKEIFDQSIEDSGGGVTTAEDVAEVNVDSTEGVLAIRPVKDGEPAIADELKRATPVVNGISVLNSAVDVGLLGEKPAYSETNVLGDTAAESEDDEAIAALVINADTLGAP